MREFFPTSRRPPPPSFFRGVVCLLSPPAAAAVTVTVQWQKGEREIIQKYFAEISLFLFFSPSSSLNLRR